MKMFRKELVEQPLSTARQFLVLLNKMEQVYGPRGQINTRWIHDDKQVISRWISQLEEAKTAEDMNDLWREIQNISHILGCTIPDELGAQYRYLTSKFYADMESAVAESRRMR